MIHFQSRKFNYRQEEKITRIIKIIQKLVLPQDDVYILCCTNPRLGRNSVDFLSIIINSASRNASLNIGYNVAKVFSMLYNEKSLKLIAIHKI